MNEKEAKKLMEKHIENRNLQKHCIATQEVMRALAKKFEENQEKWAITGLVHDLDYANTADDPKKHSLIAAEMLGNLNFPEDIIYAVKVHNEMHDLPRKSLLDKALYATDPLTGLIVASALIKPEKKLSAIDVPFLMKRFHEKAFAKGASREQIASCSDINLSLEEFMEIALEAMQSVDIELGL